MSLKFHGLTVPFPSIQALNEVIVYPAGITLGTAAIADDGTDPAYTPSNTTTANISSNTVGWTASADVSEATLLNVVSLFAEFEWQSRFNANSGNGTSSQSKVQISGNVKYSFEIRTELNTQINIPSALLIRKLLGEDIMRLNQRFKI